MIKIQIKSICGSVLFEYEKENNTIKDTLCEAVKKDANLGGADLSGANLGGADLSGAYLRGADLSRAYLRGADLFGANLSGANLGGANLSGAYLSRAYLSGANLRGANLFGANLRGANLGGANLSGAYLRGADLSRAYLSGANLGGANLFGANLSGAYLSGANLRGADLSRAYLSGANLGGANLRGAKEIPHIPLSCPSDGAFIGWKKVAYEYLVMLEIPEDARRCSATTQKCRCDKAKVLGITNIKTNEVLESVVNSNYHETTYTVGEMVYPDSFDEDRWNECSHGIHFFINKQDALDY